MFLFSQKNKLPADFNISNGHLCKSKPFDAANFALASKSGLTLFRGNIGVTLRIPEIPDQSRDINIRLPPPIHRVGVNALPYCHTSVRYRSGTVNSSFVGKVLKFELTVYFKHGILGKL